MNWTFSNTIVYGPDQKSQVYNEILGINEWNIWNRSNLITWMVGYSSLKEDPELWWVTPWEYADAVWFVFNWLIEAIEQEYPLLNNFIIDWASNVGVDGELLKTRARYWMKGLSFTCPEYLTYVDDIPWNHLFKSKDAHTYLKNYARCTDIMLIAWWRDAAYWENYLISEFDTPFKNSISPFFDPIHILTWNNSLPYSEVSNALNDWKILNASKTIMQKWKNIPDLSIEIAKERIIKEVFSFIENAAFLKK